jgi:hypothetical protein
MADYGATDRVRRSAAEQYIHPARARKQSTIKIHTGTFEKSLVQRGVLQPNRFPIVCNALRSRKFLAENSLELVDVQAPPSGRSSTVVYTYRLEPVAASPKSAHVATPNSLLDLRGVLKTTYKKLGGGEHFHKTQRAGWDR